MNWDMKPYTETVWPSKEGNLRRRAEIWRKHFLPSFLHAIWLEKFNWLIIEIGAGMWHKLRIVESHLLDGKITWIDPSAEMIRVASRLWTQLDYWEITNTGKEPESVDVVHIPQVWHHIPKEEYGRAIAEIKRILKPNGKVIVLDTFAPEDTSIALKRCVFNITNRAYAVLSQYPAQSLWVRFFFAIDSIIDPGSYDPKLYWYHSPKKSDLKEVFTGAGFIHDQEGDHNYWISEMLVFRKGDNS